MHYLKLYIEFIKLRISGVAEYRKAFIIGAIAQFVSYFAEFFLIWVIVLEFQSINGWSAPEVLLLYGLNLSSYAIAGFFFFTPTSQLPVMVKDGTFDELLIKPLNSFWYLVCREFNTGYLSHFILSLLVIIYSFNALNIDMNISNYLFLVITLIGGALIQGAALIITSVPSFWFVENKGLKEILFSQAKGFIRYPITIFNTPIQIILTLIIPYAFINFYPAQFFIEKNDFSIFNSSFQYLTPIVGIVLFIAAYLFWCIGINNYKSTGS
ncbi:ABC transporter permease [Paraliobacillus sp. X-1268]|uniref:ABC transporter permease n=1 Tax=Paraliobacillus sp. X-1268 TaxID=2213193 RepID=UPI000E3D3F27|nr:ABC-2 family transporter protein [Paraliobacillus sp. X-1268]